MTVPSLLSYRSDDGPADCSLAARGHRRYVIDGVGQNPADVKRGRLGNRCDAPAAGSSPSKPRPACALRRRLDGREACFVVNMSAVERGHEHGAIKDRALVPQMYCGSTVLPLMSLSASG
jgi:hypothetical protein